MAADKRPVRTFDDLLSYVESKKPGEQVVFTLVREGSRLEVPVELEESRN